MAAMAIARMIEVTSAKKTTMKPAGTEVRAAKTTRLNTSRPVSSVPKK
jgi:hypothetical protein